jgi:uncharacterized membrane protein YkgB
LILPPEGDTSGIITKLMNLPTLYFLLTTFKNPFARYPPLEGAKGEALTTIQASFYLVLFTFYSEYPPSLILPPEGDTSGIITKLMNLPTLYFLLTTFKNPFARYTPLEGAKRGGEIKIADTIVLPYEALVATSARGRKSFPL